MVLSGSITSWIGYCNPTMCLGTVLMAVGAGLLTTLKFRRPSPNGPFTRYCLLSVAASAFSSPSSPPKHHSIASNCLQPSLPWLSCRPWVALLRCISRKTSFRTVSLRTCARSNIFSNRLVANLREVEPNVDPGIIQDSGILDLNLSLRLSSWRKSYRRIIGLLQKF